MLQGREQFQRPQRPPEPPYSVFPKWQRVTYVYIASLAAFTSSISSSIYYPAMVSLADDLHTSLTDISFTITTYMVQRFSYIICIRMANRPRSSKALHLLL